jgi:hypothetical protein
MFQGYGLIIDKENKRFKTEVSFLGGEWQSLRDFSFVATTARKGAATFRSIKTTGNSSTVTFPLFCVYLCVDKKRKVLVMKSENKKDAVELAKGISEYLSIDLVNYIKED